MKKPDHISDVQFQYHPPEMGANYHSVSADLGTDPLGRSKRAMLSWDTKKIRGVEVPSSHQRQGIATGLWEHAQGLAASNSKIPAPKHSADRTDAGDAWARSVGGRLPRKKN